MKRVVHIVTTKAFAGVERYVADAAVETSRRGWEVTVVGGHPEHMRAALGDSVNWRPGGSAAAALRSLTTLDRQSICHAHMTVAETVAVASRPRHRGLVIGTRHFAAARGSSRAGHIVAPVVSALIDRQIAVSDYVATRLERPPDAVIKIGVRPSQCLWHASSRTVLLLQRLEPEKDTLTALKAWQQSGLAEDGWSLRVVGDGAERASLERWVRDKHVARITFAGWRADVEAELAGAGMLLATGTRDSFGLGVVEAMAAGVPVVSCAAGGHLETVGLLGHAPMFPPHDAEAAAVALRSLTREETRTDLSRRGRELVEARFTVSRHVDLLLEQYELTLASPPTRSRRGRSRPVEAEPDARLRELVVCSLEAWDDVWRRNQFFTDVLLQRNPDLRVLFVEPPADPLFDVVSRRPPALPRLRTISSDGRLRGFRPLKPLPRRLGRATDSALRKQVVTVAKIVGFTHPTLWLNDVTYAPLIVSTGWASVYDITDDWLAAPFGASELERLRRLDRMALAAANEVVVCSPDLARSRGDTRSVSLIPNGVDVEHFRRARPRPTDLPNGPVAVYVGSLHEARLDVELVMDVARSNSHLQLILVGPNALASDSRKAIEMIPNISLLGARPYDDVPAYLQHADVIVVPHRVSPFTESLDPIKAYECLTVETPTVATPVAGFRDQPSIVVADRDTFVSAVSDVLAGLTSRPNSEPPPTWKAQATEFECVLLRAGLDARAN